MTKKDLVGSIVYLQGNRAGKINGEHWNQTCFTGYLEEAFDKAQEIPYRLHGRKATAKQITLEFTGCEIDDCRITVWEIRTAGRVIYSYEPEKGRGPAND